MPGRLQALAAELSYDFIERHVPRPDRRTKGSRFFPFVFTLFFFVLMGNLLGLLPLVFTYTSHIAVTLALALMVIVTVTVVALRIHGLHFFSYFFRPARRRCWRR